MRHLPLALPGAVSQLLLTFLVRLHCGKFKDFIQAVHRLLFLTFLVRLHCGAIITLYCCSLPPLFRTFLVRLHCGIVWRPVMSSALTSS